LRSARHIGEFRATVVTGASAFPFVELFLTQLGEKTGLTLAPIAVENRLFGKSVTVSGLVTGNDIVTALSEVEIGQTLLVPDVMLKEGAGIFLDDVTLAELGGKLGCRVMAFDTTPQGLYRTLKQLATTEKT
jgi:NifB/MoaA-like Fe-S oxidoreductase